MTQLAHALKVVGLMNAQFAIKNNDVYILEVNPRASRTVPFLAKATGLPLAAIAARCMAGESLKKQNVSEKDIATHYSVKRPIFPFTKFKGVDPILGPEMRSTGEVMVLRKHWAKHFKSGSRGEQRFAGCWHSVYQRAGCRQITHG